MRRPRLIVAEAVLPVAPGRRAARLGWLADANDARVRRLARREHVDAERRLVVEALGEVALAAAVPRRARVAVATVADGAGVGGLELEAHDMANFPFRGSLKVRFLFFLGRFGG